MMHPVPWESQPLSLSRDPAWFRGCCFTRQSHSHRFMTLTNPRFKKNQTKNKTKPKQKIPKISSNPSSCWWLISEYSGCLRHQPLAPSALCCPMKHTLTSCGLQGLCCPGESHTMPGAALTLGHCWFFFNRQL